MGERAVISFFLLQVIAVTSALKKSDLRKRYTRENNNKQEKRELKRDDKKDIDKDKDLGRSG